MLDELYQDIILSYANKKEFRGLLEGDALRMQLKNPLCGDEIDLSVCLSAGCVEHCLFQGEGCLISRASAALMAELVQGKPLAEVRELIANFRTLLQSSLPQDKTDELGDLVALGGVRKFPARARCALLAFEALERLLDRDVQASEAAPALSEPK